MNQTPYVYVFIREDLSVPQQIVQASHASMEAGFDFKKPEDVCHLVLLSAKDESNLISISNYLNTCDIEHKMFYEPDITGFTSICTKYLVNDERRKLRKFTLFKDP